MDAPSSSVDYSSPEPGPAVDLVEQHRRLRTRLRWLLPAGAVLLLALAYQLLTIPERTALSGYRYQQVGVQPDSTWWLLAYRGSRAEILFSRDTAQGWQRRELGVDSAQARALALNWGGKAILVGDGGAVRVYDSLFQPLDSGRYPLGKGVRARWVAADNAGQRAVAIGSGGRLYGTLDGGTTWKQAHALAGVALDTLRGAPYWWQRAVFDSAGSLVLASNQEYQRFYEKAPSLQAADISSRTALVSSIGQWPQTAAIVPIIYFAASTPGNAKALRQDGSAALGTRNGPQHYPAAQVADLFPAAARPIGAAFSPTRPGFCLLISRSQVFAGRLGGPFTSVSPVETESKDSGAVADSVKSLKNQVGTPAATLNKKTTASSSNTKKSTQPGQKKAASTASVSTKSESPGIPTKSKKGPNSLKQDSNNPKSETNSKQESKAAPPNPVQQTTAPANQNAQQYTPPASETKEKEPAPIQPESAR